MKIRTLALAACAAAAMTAIALPAAAQGSGKIKVGLMLPYTGTFAALGTAIENGFRLYITERVAWRRPRFPRPKRTARRSAALPTRSFSPAWCRSRSSGELSPRPRLHSVTT